MKEIALGSDPNAAELKEIVKEHLTNLGYTWKDYGSDDPVYANVAFTVGESITSGKHDKGILMCGTGIGMCIAANKVPGIYAANCSDPFSVERSRKSNNVNILTLGSQVVGKELVKTLITIWLQSDYVPGGRSEVKVQRIISFEHACNKIEIS